MNKRSLYEKLVYQYEAVVYNYLALEASSDFKKLKKLILKQKKDNRFYRDIQQFLDYLEFKIKNDKIFIFPILAKKYQHLLEKTKSLLIFINLVSNQTILYHWKCLEITYLKCVEIGNFKLLDDKRREYQYSPNFNKRNALDLFDTSSRISQQKNVEIHSVFSAVAVAMQRVKLEKLKKSIINSTGEVSQVIWLKINSFSQNPFNFIYNTGSRLRALSTSSKILFALPWLPQVVGYPKRAKNQLCSTPLCPDARIRDTNVNEEYLYDLKKSSEFSAFLLEKRILEFRFSDTMFQLTPTCLKRYDETGKGEKSVCPGDYHWFLKALAIAAVEKKIKQLNRNCYYAEKIQDIFSIDWNEYNNKRLINKDLLEKADMTVWENFILHANSVREEFRRLYPKRDSRKYSFFSIVVDTTEAPIDNAITKKMLIRPSVINRSSVFQAQLTEQTRAFQASNSTVSPNDQKHEWGLSCGILIPAIAIPLVLFSIMIFFIIRHRKNSISRTSELDIKCSNPLINSDSLKTGLQDSPSAAGNMGSNSTNIQVKGLFSLWEEIKGILGTILKKKGYVQLINIRGGIDIYIKAIDLFLDNSNVKNVKKIKLLDLDIRYKLCLIFLEKIQSVLKGQILRDFKYLVEKIGAMNEILTEGCDKLDNSTGPIGIRNLRDNFFTVCFNFLKVLKADISNVQDSDNSREQVNKIFSHLITFIGKILFYEDVWEKFESNEEKIGERNITEITGQFNLLDQGIQQVFNDVIKIKDETLRKEAHESLSLLKSNIAHIHKKVIENAGYIQGKAQSSKKGNVFSANNLSGSSSGTTHFRFETNTDGSGYENLSSNGVTIHRR